MSSGGSQRASKVISWLVALALLCGATWYLLSESPQEAAATSSAGAAPPPQVTVGRPLLKELVIWDEYVARLDAIESANVRAQVSGYLASLHFQEGQLVEAGQILAVIDPRPFEAEVRRTRGDLAEAAGHLEQARSAVLQAEAEAQRATVQHDLANKQLQRTRALRQQNAVSQEDMDVSESAALAAEAEVNVARSRVNAAESNLLAAEAAVEVSQANLDAAQLNLRYTNVRAPISGRVSQRNVTVGNMVSGGGSGTATLLTNIVSLDPIHCYFDVDERSYLKYLRLAADGKLPNSREARNPVYVALSDNFNSFPYSGHMDFVDNRIDRDTGTIRSRAILSNSDLTLTPGMFARLRLPGSARQQVVLIPDKAIGTDQAEKYVLAIDENEIAQRRPVRLGPISHGLRVIWEGLDGSERIVISGLQRIRPSSKVQVNPEEEPVVASHEVLPDTFEPVPIERSLTPPPSRAANVYEAADEPPADQPAHQPTQTTTEVTAETSSVQEGAE